MAVKAWARMARLQARWMVRQVVRAGKQTGKRSTGGTKAPRKSRSAVQKSSGHWSAAIALAPGLARRYWLFKPSGLSSKQSYPLLVMLHGCGQNASDFATSTRMNRLAATYGFMVLYPEQDRLSNAQACWNWFDTRHGRASNEANSIMAALDQACAMHAIDPERVAIVGLSAGASMAALVALRFPHRFVAAVMHSGVEPTLASSAATAVGAMRGRYRMGTPAHYAEAQVLPALLVLQGSADAVVHRVNGMRAAQAWAARTHAQPQLSRVVYRGNRHPFTTMDWLVAKRRQITLCEFNGLGHAWSGGAASKAYSDPKGPDASRMVWAFVKRQIGYGPPGAYRNREMERR